MKRTGSSCLKLWMALIALLIVGCSGEGGPAREQPTVASSAPTTAATADSGVDRSELGSLRLDLGATRRDAILADPRTSAEVKAVVEDGVLTFPEYESSVLAMASCVRDAGGRFYRDDQPKLTWRGLYVYSTGFPEAVPGAQAAVSGCVERYVGILDMLWKEVTDPTREEEEAAMNALASCLHEFGLDDIIPEGRRREDFEMLGPKLAEDDRALYMSCAQRIGDEYALPYFGPTY